MSAPPSTQPPPEVPEAAKPRSIKIGTAVETIQPQVTEQKAA
jgi:hypothetical protein